MRAVTFSRDAEWVWAPWATEAALAEDRLEIFDEIYFLRGRGRQFGKVKISAIGTQRQRAETTSETSPRLRAQLD